LPPGSVGVDVGCGNGKNLAINPDIFIVGSDRSESLVRIAAGRPPHDVVVADILDLPHPSGKFDFAICIAVVHHLSTTDRRVAAIKSMLSLLRKTGLDTHPFSGTALVYVWALEQKDSRRGWDDSHPQDVMVPWVLKQKALDSATQEKVLHRYYHLYRKGELEDNVHAAGGEVIQCGYEKDNWWAIARPRVIPHTAPGT
jgi:tRNA (uracil-5-)-methyltransferase TRM9